VIGGFHAQRGGTLLTSYSRVTVVNGARRVDLALPSALPLADVVPQVLRFCAPEEQPNRLSEFTLARIGGQSLSLSQSLAEAGVRDGDVVELRTFGQDSRPALVEDVRDAIEDAVDGAGEAWTSQSTVTFSIVATCVVVGLFAFSDAYGLWAATMAGDPLESGPTGELVSTFAAAALLLVCTWVATRWAAGWAVHVVASTAAGLALLGGVDLVADRTDSHAVALSCGLASAAVVSGLARLLTQRASILLAATAVPLVAVAFVLAGELFGAETGVMVRVVAVLAVLSVGVMPRVSLAVGGLSSADYRVRNAGRLTDAALQARFRESSWLLLGSVIGVSFLVGMIAFWLGLRDEEWSQDIWDRALALSLAAVLLLRSRVFSRIQFMLPLRMAAVFGCLSTIHEQALQVQALDDWLLAAVAAAGTVAAGISVLTLSDITRARIKRTLNAVEFLVVVDLVVVTMGAVALYDVVRN
jgi:type VII secretion integral membrane protein EccD